MGQETEINSGERVAKAVGTVVPEVDQPLQNVCVRLGPRKLGSLLQKLSILSSGDDLAIPLYTPCVGDLDINS